MIMSICNSKQFIRICTLLLLEYCLIPRNSVQNLVNRIKPLQTSTVIENLQLYNWVVMNYNILILLILDPSTCSSSCNLFVWSNIKWKQCESKPIVSKSSSCQITPAHVFCLILIVMPNCAYPVFPGFLLCGFLYLMSFCTLVMSGLQCEHPSLGPTDILFNQYCCFTCCFMLHPHSHNSKTINIYITQTWVYHR